MKVIVRIWSALISLLVDDGFLAIAALAAIGVVWLLSKDGAMGPTNLVGWILFVLLAGSTVISVRRAVAKSGVLEAADSAE